MLFFPFILTIITRVLSLSSDDGDDVTEWLAIETGVGSKLMLTNVHPAGTAPGIVIASPSRIYTSTENDYFYHWTRDSALTMDVIATMYQNGQKDLENILWDYATMTRRMQENLGPNSLGEPKFNVDGSLFTGPWCRPQNDGPALTVSTMVKFARAYLSFGGSLDRVKRLIYGPWMPANTLAKAYLEYVANKWSDMNTCDLWEEQRGDHFYTRMVQRRGLLDGASLAYELGDKDAAKWYESQAMEISRQLNKHWSDEKKIIITTFGQDSRITKELDISILLATLHTDVGDNLSFHVLDDRMLATVLPLIESFRPLYKINSYKTNNQGMTISLAIGRYKEDEYTGGNGTTFKGGNPWYLATAAVAEYLYKVRTAFARKSLIAINNRNYGFFSEFLGVYVDMGDVYSKGEPEFTDIMDALLVKGDSFVRRIMFHSVRGRLPEEYRKENGADQGAKDLTWSYASVITANLARSTTLKY